MQITFSGNKTKLTMATIATMAAGLGLPLASCAQATNDAGTLITDGHMVATIPWAA